MRLTFTAAAFCAAALFVFFSCRSVRDLPPAPQDLQSAPPVLQLTDAKTGAVCVLFPLNDAGQFSIAFKHSVNQSMVEEGYDVRGGDIYLAWCLYDAFGAGVATTLEDGQTLSYTADGRMLISGFNRRIPALSYEVSTVYDHILRLGSTTVNLTDLGLKGKRIRFEIVR